MAYATHEGIQTAAAANSLGYIMLMGGDVY